MEKNELENTAEEFGRNKMGEIGLSEHLFSKTRRKSGMSPFLHHGRI